MDRRKGKLFLAKHIFQYKTPVELSQEFHSLFISYRGAFLLPVFAYRDHLFRLAFLVQDEHLHVCSRCMERFHQASGGNGGSACFLGRIDYKYSHVAECFGKSTAFTAFYPQIRGFFSQ